MDLTRLVCLDSYLLGFTTLLSFGSNKDVNFWISCYMISEILAYVNWIICCTLDFWLLYKCGSRVSNF